MGHPHTSFSTFLSTMVSKDDPDSSRWWSEKTIVAVTGGNKGIGFALVKRLAELGLTVILTCRDESRGREAVEKLKEQGFHVEFFHLDVVVQSSIEAFVTWLTATFGGLDILVNNAAVSFNEINENSVEHAETVIKTNFYGPKLLTEALLPLFRRSETISRVFNISSRLGLLNVSNPVVREILENEEKLSQKGIDFVVNRFLEDVKIGLWKDEGWPKVWTDYSVSKLALNAYSRLLAKRFEKHRLSINCFCPGFTQTGMTQGRGIHTADTAAEVGAKLILLPPNKLPTGVFFSGSKPFLYSNL
ncbi:hypothetical protein GIB67_032886 [Kingdonia uniflora]|uniref:Uncharacterized protein n=1 Tax=Kingdonia uniflora TaxID=39325 RepID=A0A7J7NCS5_9MAGN|nr:hypothetical protein GIB67_032886 [Kingdonia uniflora]